MGRALKIEHFLLHAYLFKSLQMARADLGAFGVQGHGDDLAKFFSSFASVGNALRVVLDRGMENAVVCRKGKKSNESPVGQR